MSKTAMQELIKYVTDISEWMPNEQICEAVIHKAAELLAKEKEQIVDAFIRGEVEGGNVLIGRAETYFNQTYKPK